MHPSKPSSRQLVRSLVLMVGIVVCFPLYAWMSGASQLRLYVPAFAQNLINNPQRDVLVIELVGLSKLDRRSFFRDVPTTPGTPVYITMSEGRGRWMPRSVSTQYPAETQAMVIKATIKTPPPEAEENQVYLEYGIEQYELQNVAQQTALVNTSLVAEIMLDDQGNATIKSLKPLDSYR